MPNGVGTQGRGRSGMNSPLANGSDCVVAMQQRRQSLLAAAEYRPTRTVIVLTTAGAGKFDGMPDRELYPQGSEGEAQFAFDVERFIECNFDGKGVDGCARWTNTMLIPGDRGRAAEAKRRGE